MNYNNYITPSERLQAIKRGFMCKVMEECKDVNGKLDPDKFNKCATSVPSNILDTVKFVMLTGVGLGIPTGILLHNLKQRIAANRLSEKDLQEKAKLYRGLTENLKEVEVPQNEVV